MNLQFGVIILLFHVIDIDHLIIHYNVIAKRKEKIRKIKQDFE